MLVSGNKRNSSPPGIILKILTITTQQLQRRDTETVIMCIVKLITAGF